MRTTSIALIGLLLLSCAASEPAPAPGPDGSGEPDGPAPLTEPIAFEILRDARWVALPQPDQRVLRRLYVLEAFEMLLAASDAQVAFERLQLEGNAEGKVYAMCGLWHLDRQLADQLLADASQSDAEVAVVRGTSRKRETLSSLVSGGALAGLTSDWMAISVLRARRAAALLREESLEHWVAAATGDDDDALALGRVVLYQVGAPAVPGLLALCRDTERDPDERLAAFATLRFIGPRARSAVPALRELIDSTIAEDRPRLALGAISALGGIGPWARPALPRIKGLLGNDPLDDPISRRQVSAAISAIE